MKRRICLCLGLLTVPGLLAAVSLSAATAIGQSVVTTVAGISPNIKNASSAQPFQATIKAFIDQQVNAILGDDTTAQETARQSLISQCTSGSSDSYFDVYATDLNDAVVEALGKKLSLRARLNLAVAIEAVARIAQTDRVEPSVVLFLKDRSWSVAMWGAKAAKPVIEVIIQSPAMLANNKLLLELPVSVKQHIKSGFLAQSCYEALIPTIQGFSPSQINALVPPLIKPLLDILEERVEIYNTAVPDVPDAEAVASSFLARHYNACLPQQQQRMIQLMTDLLSSAGIQIASASKAQHEQIIRMITYTAQGLYIIAQSEPAAVAALGDLLHMGPGTSASNIALRTGRVYPAMKKFAPYLKPPPHVTPAPPTTATSDQDASG